MAENADDVATGPAPLADVRVSIVNPVFRNSSPEVPEWLQGLSGDTKETVRVLRGIIAELAPDAHEIIYHSALGYGPTSSGFDRILYISIFKDHINLGFFYGAGLDDPGALLEGSGKQMRHVKLTCSQSLPAPQSSSYSA